MTKRYVDPSKIQEPPQATEPFSTDVSIDDLLGKGLAALDRLMKVIMMDISTGAPERDTVMNLKDVMAMLHELKKKEKELLENLSDEELESLIKK